MDPRIPGLEQQILSLKQELATLRRAQPPQPVEDHVFATPEGPRRLSELFGDREDLLVVHNMGVGCSYCTLWADGFNGVVPELLSRAAFVLVSPDPAEKARRFAAGRGWRFPVVSDESLAFSKALGRWQEDSIWPGVSGLRRTADGIVRIATADLGEGDDFCAVWHLFDLLRDGWNGWSPAFRLDAAVGD
jgi:predicted dithiol-disulfide oxidoreductase (DUF899 family)